MSRLCKILIFHGALALGLAGCGSDDDDPVTNVIIAPELQGQFTDSCDSSLVLKLSERISLLFSGNEVRQIQNLYLNGRCDQVGAQVQYRGTFQVEDFNSGETNDNDSGITVGPEEPDPLPEDVVNSDYGQLNVRFESAVLIVHDQQVADSLSAVRFCGISSFPLGQEIAVVNPSGTCPLTRVPADRFGTYRLDGNRLFLDSEDLTSMADSPDNRDLSLSDEVFVRDGSN